MSGFVYVPVRNSAGSLVDAEDFERVSARHWYAVRRANAFYAESSTPTRTMMHRFVIGSIPAGMVVDHINGDPLDNRKANLRVCRQGENAKNRVTSKNNTSGFKGVSWKADIRRWRARIMVDRKEISLGAFDDAADAARAYDAAALVYFGQFANLNFGDAA